MIRRYRMVAVHLLAVLLPCGFIGLLGYKWLELEREMEPRRGKEAAEAEAAGTRRALTVYLGATAAYVSQRWAGRLTGGPPFALPPDVPEVVDTAYLFSSEGKLIYPDYEGAYRRAISDFQSFSEHSEWQQTTARASALEARGQISEARHLLQAFEPEARRLGFESSVLLELGRLSLQQKQYDDAESHAQRIFQCCAETRDEYGVSFALYAARQLHACWEAKGVVLGRFPQLAGQLTELLRAGWLGHPTDLLELLELAKKAGSPPAGVSMLAGARQITDRIRMHIDNGKRLERWVSGSAATGSSTSQMTFATLWNGETPQIVGLYRGDGSRVLVVLFATDPLAAWINATGEKRRFAAYLIRAGKEDYGSVLRTALLPEAPDFDLVLRAKELDPAQRTQRQVLFVGALIAALLLMLLVGYFAFRDFSREMKLAGMRASFVAGVTHDLKTPLTSIRMLAETLQLGRARDAAVTRQMLGAIVNESERLTRLLDNVLTFAKIEKGSRSYRLEEFDLTAAVLAAAQRFKYVLEEDGFHLLTETESNRLCVMADADALAQTLLNLLSNAVKYSGKSREIHLSIQARGREVEVRVQDHGIGIARSEQRRIFESFYRVPEAARETTGAGLGLALVRHFAQAHRGRVTVSSEPGKGSAFSLWLPLVKTDAGRSVSAENSKPEGDHGEDSHS